jgi:hypothetical protein
MSLNKWRKVRGVFSQIESLCNSLKQWTKQCDQDMVSISIVSPTDCTKQDLNELPPLFMYSQILKEILLALEYDKNAKEKLIQLWREQYHGNEPNLKKINEFERDYNPNLAIKWYTREVFTYSMLNRALRVMNTNMLIKMGFLFVTFIDKLNNFMSYNRSLHCRSLYIVVKE